MRKDTCVRICSAVGICTLSLQLPLCVPSLTRDMSNNMSKVTKVVVLVSYGNKLFYSLLEIKLRYRSWLPRIHFSFPQLKRTTIKTVLAKLPSMSISPSNTVI